jgi:hypothetical protein
MLVIEPTYNYSIGDIAYTSYARGIVYRDNNKVPVKATVQLIDSTTGTPVSSPQAIEAGHQFLVWTNNPEQRSILIKSDGLNDSKIPFMEFEESWPTALEVYLKGGKSGNLLLVAAGASALFFLSAGKRKKVGKVDLYKYYEGIHPIAKGILAVGGSYLIYRVLDKLLKKPPPSGDEPKAAEQELAQLAAQGIYPTYTNTQYESFCQALINAAWGMGTDENGIYQVFEAMNNKADVLKLIVKFGIREWDDPSIPFQYLQGTVSTLINGELNGSEKDKLNHILSAKGIDFRFA